MYRAFGSFLLNNPAGTGPMVSFEPGMDIPAEFDDQIPSVRHLVEEIQTPPERKTAPTGATERTKAPTGAPTPEEKPNK